MRRASLSAVIGILCVSTLPGTGHTADPALEHPSQSSKIVWELMTSGTTADLRAVSGTGAVVAVGDRGVLLVSDGDGWTQVPTPTFLSLNAVRKVSATEAWIVGDAGTVLHYGPAGAVKVVAGTSANLHAVWVLSESAVYAAGANGTVVAFDGDDWNKMATPTISRLSGIAGRSQSDVFAVGAGGTILHYDGTAWQRMESGTTRHLNAVWAEGPGQVYVVGDAGTILRYDGARWTRVPSPTTRNLNGVWAGVTGDIFAVGDAGTVLQGEDGFFALVGSGTFLQLNAVFGGMAVGNAGVVVTNADPSDPFSPVFFQQVDASAEGEGVHLSWDVFADEAFGGFRLYRSTRGVPEHAVGPDVLPATARSYVDSDVVPGTTYTYAVAIVTSSGEELRAREVNATVPKATVTLQPGAPNPFSGSAIVEYTLPDAQTVTLRVFDVLGRRVATLVDGRRPGGTHTAVWNGLRAGGDTAAAGTYFVRLDAGSVSLTTKIVLVH